MKTLEEKNEYQKEWNRKNRERIRAYNQKAYAARPEKIKATVERHRAKKRGEERETREWSHVTIARLRNRAKARGWEFDVSAADLPIPDVCPVLDIPLDWSDRNHTPSIDRVDPTKGYVKGNVTVVSNKVNSAKSDLTLSELRAMVKYYEQWEK